MESAIDAGFRGVNSRLDVLNGQVARNSEYRVDHSQAHAVSDSVTDATSALRRGDWARFTALIGIIVTLSGVVFKIIGR